MPQKTYAVVASLILFFLAVPGPARGQENAEQKEPSGTIEINETQIGFIVGGSVGQGILHFQGKDYAFKTGGLGLGGAGITKINAVGEVYDLDDVSRFPGTYNKLKVGGAIGVGKGGLNMVNEHGVILNLTAKMKGVAFTMGVEGVKITLVE